MLSCFRALQGYLISPFYAAEINNVVRMSFIEMQYMKKVRTSERCALAPSNRLPSVSLYCT